MALSRVTLKGNSVFDIQQALDRILAEVGNQVGAVGIQNVNFVSPDGDNNTAQPGSLTYKYQTIQAAVNAAPANTLVLVCPGFYPESVVIPATTLGLVIAALEPRTVFVQPAAADVPALSFAPSVASQRVTCVDIAFGANINSPTLGVVDIDCTAGGLDDLLFIGGEIGNANPGVGLHLIGVLTLKTFNLNCGSQLLFYQVGDYSLQQGSLGDLTDNYDISQPVPGPRNGPARVQDCDVGTVILQNQAQATFIYCTAESGRLETTQPAASSGQMNFEHSEVRSGLAYVCDQTGNPGDFFQGGTNNHSKIRGGLSATNANAGVHVRVSAEQCVFEQGSPILAGSCGELNILKSLFAQIDLASAGAGPDEGTIDRDTVVMLGTALVAGPQAIPVSPKLGNALYMPVVNNQISQGFPVTFTIAYSANTILVTVEAVWNGAAYVPAGPTTADIALIAQRN